MPKSKGIPKEVNKVCKCSTCVLFGECPNFSKPFDNENGDKIKMLESECKRLMEIVNDKYPQEQRLLREIERQKLAVEETTAELFRINKKCGDAALELPPEMLNKGWELNKCVREIVRQNEKYRKMGEWEK